jgi:hypothetical protein
MNSRTSTSRTAPHDEHSTVTGATDTTDRLGAPRRAPPPGADAGRAPGTGVAPPGEPAGAGRGRAAPGSLRMLRAPGSVPPL